MIKSRPRGEITSTEPGYVSTAVKINKYRTRIAILWKAGGCAILMALVIYVVAILYARYGSFSVSVNKFDSQEYALTLSEDPNFSTRSVQLNAKISEDVTNIASDDIPMDVDSINGSHSGDNYIAYTFYLMNAGDLTVTCEYYINIVNATSDIDKAVRVRLYTDGVPVTYARVATNGSPEPGTTPFQYNDADSITTVMKTQRPKFAPGEKMKFTIVIWLDGNDPECLDDVIGGTMKLNMVMTVVEGSAEKSDGTN